MGGNREREREREQQRARAPERATEHQRERERERESARALERATEAMQRRTFIPGLCFAHDFMLISTKGDFLPQRSTCK